MKELIIILMTFADGTWAKRESQLQESIWNSPQYSQMTCQGYVDQSNKYLSKENSFVGHRSPQNHKIINSIRYLCQTPKQIQ